MNPLLAPGGLLANTPTASFLQLAQALEFVNSRGEEIPSQGRLTENDALRIAAACQWFYEISVLRSISAFAELFARFFPRFMAILQVLPHFNGFAGFVKLLSAALVLPDELLAHFVFRYPDAENMVHHLLRILYGTIRSHPKFPKWNFSSNDLDGSGSLNETVVIFAPILQMTQTLLLLTGSDKDLPTIPLDPSQINFVVPHVRALATVWDAEGERSSSSWAILYQDTAKEMVRMLQDLQRNQAQTGDLRTVPLDPDRGPIPRWRRCSAVLQSALVSDEGVDLICVPAGEAKLTCARCKLARYCSKEHQKIHWKIHKKTCFAPSW